MASIYYDAALTVSILNSDNAACEALFNLWFDMLQRMEHDSTQRLIVLSMGSLMALPSASLPPIVRSNLPAMMKQMVRELVIIEETLEKGDDDEKDEDEDEDYGDDASYDNDDDDDDDEEEDTAKVIKGAKIASKLTVPEGGYDEDEDCENVEDEEYRKLLEEHERDGAVRRQRYVDGEPVDDEEDDNEDYIFTSPIDNMDMSKFFLETMAAAQAREPELIASLQATLEVEDHQRVASLAVKVAERVAGGAEK